MTATGHPEGAAVATAEPTATGLEPGALRPAASALPQRFGRNVMMNYAAQGTAALSALVLTPLLLHHLGKSAFAVWVLAINVVMYLELFELGFGGATTKLVAEDAVVRPDAALRTLNTTFFALIPLGVVAFAAGVGVAFLFPVVVHVTPVLHHQVIVVIVVLAAGLGVSIPGDTFGGALIGHQRFDMLGLSNSLLVGSTLVASVVIVELGGGLVALATAFTALGVVFHLVRLVMLRRVLPGARVAWHLADRERLREVMHVSGWFLLSAVIYCVYNACDVIVVGIVLGLKPAAVYAVASKLATAAIAGLESLAQVFFPYASATARNENRDALTDITVDGTRASMFAGMVISLLFIVLAAPGIRVWVGPGFGESAKVLLVLAIAIAVSSPVKATNVVLTGSGRIRTVCAVRGVEVAVDLALSVTLARVMGPVGVAVGTLGGILLARLPGFVFFGASGTNTSPATLLRRAVLPHVPPVLAMTGVLLLMRPVAWHLSGLVAAGLVGCATYVAVYFALSATPGERQRARAAFNRLLPARWRAPLEEPLADGQHAGN
jgi:O-antigen/teichoic acid export membrane protein